MSATTLSSRKGQSLESGSELCVVEVMKMENILRAGRSRKIANSRARPGDNLTVEQIILEFETGHRRVRRMR